jgi:hypothetical protein
MKSCFKTSLLYIPTVMITFSNGIQTMEQGEHPIENNGIVRRRSQRHNDFTVAQLEARVDQLERERETAEHRLAEVECTMCWLCKQATRWVLSSITGVQPQDPAEIELDETNTRFNVDNDVRKSSTKWKILVKKEREKRNLGDSCSEYYEEEDTSSIHVPSERDISAADINKLCSSAYNGREDILKESTQVFVHDTSGKTPLHYAAREGCKGTVKVIIQKQSNNVIDNFPGFIPLHAAVRGAIKTQENSNDLKKYTEVIRALLKAGEGRHRQAQLNARVGPIKHGDDLAPYQGKTAYEMAETLTSDESLKKQLLSLLQP